MAVETRRATSWAGTGTANSTNIGDGNTGTYADVTAVGTWSTTQTRTGTVSSWETKAQTWSDYKIKITDLHATVTSINWGGGGELVLAEYSTNSGGTWTAFPSGPVGAILDTGVYNLDSGTISGNPTLSTIYVRIQIRSYFGSQDTLNRLSGDICVAYVAEVYIEGTYTSDDFTALTFASSGTNSLTVDYGQNSIAVNATYTGAQPTVSGDPGGSWSVSTYTTSVAATNTAGYTFTFYQSASATTRYVYLTVRTPSVSTPTSTSAYVTYGGTKQFSGGVVSNAVNTTTDWAIASSSGGGSINSSGLYTAGNIGVAYIRAYANVNHAYYADSSVLNIVAAPVATSLNANVSPPVLYGNTAVTITPVFSGGTANIYDQYDSLIASGVTNNVAFGVQSSGFIYARTYTLVVTNLAGDSAQVSSAALVVQTVSLTGIYGLTNGGAYTYGQSVGSVYCTSTGGYTNNINWTSSPLYQMGYSQTASGGGNTWTAPSSGSSCTVTATSNDDPTKTITYTLYIYAAAVATSLTPSTTSPLYGATITLTPSFSGAYTGYNRAIGSSGSQSTDVTTAAVSGTPVTTAAITSAKTYTLSVANQAGAWAYVNSATVTPQTVAVANISPAASSTTVNTTGLQFTSSVSGASNTAITWSFGGVGTITAGQNTNTVTWTAPTTPQTVTITATAQANGTTNKTTTVTVGAVGGSGSGANKSATASSF